MNYCIVNVQILDIVSWKDFCPFQQKVASMMSANYMVVGNYAILQIDSDYDDIRVLYNLWYYSTCKKLIFM